MTAGVRCGYGCLFINSLKIPEVLWPSDPEISWVTGSLHTHFTYDKKNKGLLLKKKYWNLSLSESNMDGDSKTLIIRK